MINYLNIYTFFIFRKSFDSLLTNLNFHDLYYILHLVKIMDNISISTLKREMSLVETVFIVLKDEIISGKFTVGNKLPSQLEFCKKFGVSRTVIREAWNKLSSLGLIETVQGDGTFVRSPSAGSVLEPIYSALLLEKSSIAELLECRYYTETITAALAAERRNESDIARIEKTINLMKENAQRGDLDAVVEYDIAFHRALAEISQNTIFKRLLDTVSIILRRFLNTYTRIPGTPEHAIGYHQRILNAIIENNPELAKKAMKEHLLNVYEILRKELNIEIKLH